MTIESSSGGDIHLYVDGELVNSNLNNNRNGDLQGGVLQVASQGGGTPGYFDRYIDDVRLWHEALSPTDVEAVYASSDALYKATKVVEYGYDAFDRRVVKEIDANGNGAMTDAGDTASQYVYDGQDIVLAFDKAAALTNRYLHGPAVDQILSDEQYTGGASPTNSAGTTYWPLADNQGSVRQLVTSDGEEAKQINYDSFGQMSVVSGAAVDHIFAYTGREHDAESHLQYNRARYYDAALGRWISEDPIGFAAGDANLARYVGNGPTNATDPSGLIGPQLVDPTEEPLDAGATGRHRTAVPNSAKPMPMPGVLDQMDESLKQLVEMIKDIQGQLDGLTAEERAVIIGLLQTVLDIGGIFEPTPFCDLASGAISLGQEDYWGVLASGFALFPYLGDVGKAFRIPKWIDRIVAAIEAARNSEKIASLIRPLLTKLADFIGKLPFERMPDDAADALKKIKGKLDDYLNGPPKEVPPVIYRGGKPSPSNLTPRPKDEGNLSFRDSLSNPVEPGVPGPLGGKPVFDGDDYIAVDTSKLPPGSVVPDGVAGSKTTPPGHVSVNGASPGELKSAVIPKPASPPYGPNASGKFPKKSN